MGPIIPFPHVTPTFPCTVLQLSFLIFANLTCLFESGLANLESMAPSAKQITARYILQTAIRNLLTDCRAKHLIELSDQREHQRL